MGFSPKRRLGSVVRTSGASEHQSACWCILPCRMCVCCYILPCPHTGLTENSFGGRVCASIPRHPFLDASVTASVLGCIRSCHTGLRGLVLIGTECPRFIGTGQYVLNRPHLVVLCALVSPPPSPPFLLLPSTPTNHVTLLYHARLLMRYV